MEEQLEEIKRCLEKIENLSFEGDKSALFELTEEIRKNLRKIGDELKEKVESWENEEEKEYDQKKEELNEFQKEFENEYEQRREKLRELEKLAKEFND